jgi:peptidoglycan/xylan/chitin deacetylase (PgdA/CDA1 family)
MLILCYHELAEEEATPWIFRPETFSQHLDVLRERNYRTGKLPTSANAADVPRVIITFDDGTSGCIRHAHSRLLDRGMSAYFYICPGYTNGVVQPFRPTTFLTWQEIRELAQFHVIGAHSMTHGVFDDLPFHRRREEMSESKQVIEDQLSQSCTDWATPYGYVDPQLQQLARDVGFSTLVTTQFGANTSINPFCLERWEVHSPCPRDEFVATLDRIEALK